MAQALPHKNEEIVSFIYNNKVDYLLISVGLTSKLQPLDLTVNRVFKNPYKKYTDYVASHKENFFNGVGKPSRDDILKRINGIWYSE